jgi:uncharacterized protein YdeI (YjbR/CyaY-like superfamily)
VSAKANGQGNAHTFRAKLVRIGSFYGVEVPAAVSKAIGRRGWVPVVGRVNGVARLSTTMMPKGGGRHILLVASDARAKAGAKLGAMLAIELRVEDPSRKQRLPDDFASALREEGALDGFHALNPAKRRELLRWVTAAVHPTTREDRIARAVREAVAQRQRDEPRSRGEVLIPEDLAEALREEGVLPDWETMPPGRRAQMVRWIEDAAQEATRLKRIGRAVQEALAQHEKRVDRGMC